MHYVYIIQCSRTGKYYKGYSLDPLSRLAAHNAGKSKYTARFGPWKLVFVLQFTDRAAALKKERLILQKRKGIIIEISKTCAFNFFAKATA